MRSMSLVKQGTDSDFRADTELLTVAEVSVMFRVSKMTIYRMVHAGELAHVRVGRSFRIPADSVRAVMGSQ